MTTGKNSHKRENEEQSPVLDCCSRQNFAGMMDKYGEDMTFDCRAMMQEMMKGGCYQPEKK